MAKTSKQLESILGRATTATPRQTQPKTLAVVNDEVPVQKEPPQSESTQKEIRTAKQQTDALIKQERQKSIQAFVPASVARAINIKAAEEDTTVRTIILQGLRALGMEVADAELRDRRK
jgi:hypothetical protein